MFDRRDEGAALLDEGWRPRTSLAPRLEESVQLDPDTDQALFFAALVSQTVASEQRVPKQVLVYEASRLRLDALDDVVLRRLVSALAQLTYARAGHCGELPSSPPASFAREDVRRSLDRWLPAASQRLDEVHPDLGRIERVLIGGARACCEIHGGRDERAARAIESWLADATALGVHPSQTALLRGWVALVDGDVEAVQERLGEVRRHGRLPEDERLYGLLRDAVASSDDASRRDAAERLVDRRWLSRLVLVAARRTLVEDGLMGALEASPAASASSRLAAGEAELIEAARRRYPLFDQTHQGDQGALERLADLFRSE
mgnify:FL=1